MAVYALDFELDSTQYCVTASMADLSLHDTDFTIEFWMNAEGLGSAANSTNRIIEKGNGSVGSWGIEIGVYGDSGKTTKICFYRSMTWNFYPSTTDLTTGDWIHIAYTYNNSTGDLKVYINGTLSDTFPDVVSPDESTSIIMLGAGWGITAWNYDGILDEIRISDSIRYTENFTPSTVRFAPDANTLALWHLDEGTGTTAEDSSGNDYDFTLVADHLPTWVEGYVTVPLSEVFMNPKNYW